MSIELLALFHPGRQRLHHAAGAGLGDDAAAGPRAGHGRGPRDDQRGRHGRRRKDQLQRVQEDHVLRVACAV